MTLIDGICVLSEIASSVRLSDVSIDRSSRSSLEPEPLLEAVVSFDG